MKVVVVVVINWLLDFFTWQIVRIIDMYNDILIDRDTLGRRGLHPPLNRFQVLVSFFFLGVIWEVEDEYKIAGKGIGFVRKSLRSYFHFVVFSFPLLSPMLISAFTFIFILLVSLLFLPLYSFFLLLFLVEENLIWEASAITRLLKSMIVSDWLNQNVPKKVGTILSWRIPVDFLLVSSSRRQELRPQFGSFQFLSRNPRSSLEGKCEGRGLRSSPSLRK